MKIINKLLIVACLCLPLLTFAQLENRFSIGPRLGVNFATTDAESSEFNTGIVAGVTSTYSFNEQTGLTVDLLYSAETYNADIDYLRIPILFNAFFGDLGESFRPKIYAGVAPGFFINGEVNGIDVEKSTYNSIVFDAVGGLGFNYRIASRVWLNVDVRAALGLTPVTDLPEVSGRNIQLSVGVAYGL
ncbi:MAG: porin family protein [Bacteroidota bacterium]